VWLLITGMIWNLAGRIIRWSRLCVASISETAKERLVDDGGQDCFSRTMTSTIVLLSYVERVDIEHMNHCTTEQRHKVLT